MFSSTIATAGDSSELDPLDRVAMAYLTLPVAIFLLGWFELWAALPLVACMIYALKPLIGSTAGASRLPVTPLQLAIAVIVGGAWTALGGTGHLVFANADWHVRDAVLHDLVSSPWPVGYGLLDGKESLLRAPIAYYLPAALIGKVLGLFAAHMAMAVWTAVGVSLFLLQVLSLTPSRTGVAVTVVAVLVFFSGFDIIGNILNDGPRFFIYWSIAKHLEWWAGNYQYSSMTTQLFWVPNHALGGWLVIGMLCRDGPHTRLNSSLPILLVSAAVWSPLTALGLVPFFVWKASAGMLRDKSTALLHPRIWAPALAIGLVVAAYLALDPGGISKGLAVASKTSDSVTMELLRQAQFFLLEAGIIGFATLAIRRSSQTVLALVILALLPLVYLGPGNDIVMRASIPALTVVAVAACLALIGERGTSGIWPMRAALGCMLAVGAMTPIQELARAAVLGSWPINLDATVVGANCGTYPPHYIARLGNEVVRRLLRRPHALALGPLGKSACDNPAISLMYKRGLLQW